MAFGQADDHNQRKIATQDGLAARVDIATQRIDRPGDGRHDARVVARHQIQHVDMFKSTHRLPS